MRDGHDERHYTDCPRCGLFSTMIVIEHDRYGKPLYECRECGTRALEEALKQAARDRRMRD